MASKALLAPPVTRLGRQRKAFPCAKKGGRPTALPGNECPSQDLTKPKTSGFTFYLSYRCLRPPMNWGFRALAMIGNVSECRDCRGMPYKLRLDFPAQFTTCNRGNYRRWLFEQAGAKAAYEACLYPPANAAVGAARLQYVAGHPARWHSPFYASKHVGVLRRHRTRHRRSRHLPAAGKGKA